MEKAIKKAIEGGWKSEDIHKDFPEWIWQPVVCCDPLFWQALGKAEGWKIWDLGVGQTSGTDWKEQWHNFIDHLIQGKDINSFFNELSK